MVDQGSGVGPTGGSGKRNIRPEDVSRTEKARKTGSAGKTAEPSAPPTAGETDLMVISGSAKQIAHLRELIRQTPEIRSEKVMEIKNRLERGEYHVPAREILRKMVETAVAEARNRKSEQ